MRPCPGNWSTIGQAVMFYARAAHACSAGIKCWHCNPNTSILTQRFGVDTSRDPPCPSGFDTWLPSVSLQIRVSNGSPYSGLAWSLYKCAALCRAVFGSSATERPLWTIREEKGISSRFQVSISWRYDLSCLKLRTVQTFDSCTSRLDLCYCLVVQTPLDNMSKNKPSTSMANITCESKLRSVLRSCIHPCPV